jgi:hypothetical protein
MNYPNQAETFCKSQKSINAALVNFIDEFTAWYQAEDQAEQEILAQCVQQMFRKYYYSALAPEAILTPAAIANTLCERRFGKDLMGVPVLNVTFKGRKIARLEYQIIDFRLDTHPFLNDLEFFLRAAAAGIRMDAPGIPDAVEYPRLKEGAMIFDRHYFNVLGLAALEAGYIECVASGKSFIAKATAAADEFFGLSGAPKLRRVIESLAALCSKTIGQFFPELRPEFTVDRVLGFLTKPGSLEKTLTTAFSTLGMDINRLSRFMADKGSGAADDIGEIIDTVGLDRENTAKIFWLENMLDIYFFTPFGYYLQVIQPVYSEVYDMAAEFDKLLEDASDFQMARNLLFSGALGFDLTVLGEALLAGSKKPRRSLRIPKDIGDEEMLQAVLARLEYLVDDGDEAEADEDAAEEFDEAETLGLFEPDDLPVAADKPKGGQVIDFRTRKPITPPRVEPDDRVYVFKVKLFADKRVWRQIEIKGRQSLHHLHESIMDSFGLDGGHLYAFFLSNRFWDKRTEYAHPAAEGRPATKLAIDRIDWELKQKIAYVYDFGDEQRFEVELIAVQDPQKVKYPREVKRNKPAKTVCDKCQQRPIEWFCNEHGIYLCDKCVAGHEGCFITVAIL